MKSERPHPGITMHQIKVGGGFVGLLFTVGSMAIFLLAIPALWVPVLGSLVFGLVFAAVLRLVRR
jgi:Na+-transporting NADH:ubiquinone oxidoreductase subunit NqrB